MSNKRFLGERMEIIYDTKSQWQQKQLTSTTFLKIYELFSIKEDYILRELKENFTKEEKLETKLEQLIEQQIILREKRHYFLNLPNLSLNEDKRKIDEWVALFMAELQEKPISEQLMSLVLLADNACEFAPFRLPEKVNFAFFSQLENDLGSLYSFSLKRTAFNLPNYFLWQRQHSKDHSFFSLEQLIGDVEPNYYLDQVFVILEKILAGRRRIRPSIFTESLKKVAIIEEKANYTIVAPIVHKLTSTWLHSTILFEFTQLSYYLQRRIIGELLIQLNLENKTLILLKTTN